MFTYCPSCASTRIQFTEGRRFYCPDCGFVYYHNTAAATGCIISTGETMVLLVRGKEPAKGKLDLPGGFVDPAEGALDGLRRECREELGLDPEAFLRDRSGGAVGGLAGNDGFSLFASFPNTYPYKGILYNTCDMFFTISVPGLTEADLRLDPEEIGGVRFVRPEEVDFEELAFDSTKRAVRAYVEYTQKTKH
ncbi:DNA mismatch repair protein MutT [Spirochaetia bacterium]|nr:DNA mismatch repair protein MutT [Spirochaetia bacterium]